jgi:hypothetical protein
MGDHLGCERGIGLEVVGKGALCKSVLGLIINQIQTRSEFAEFNALNAIVWARTRLCESGAECRCDRVHL